MLHVILCRTSRGYNDGRKQRYLPHDSFLFLSLSMTRYELAMKCMRFLPQARLFDPRMWGQSIPTH